MGILIEIVGSPVINVNTDLSENSLTIHTLFPKSIIEEFYGFVRKGLVTNIESNSYMIKEIDQYIDNNSSRWIYNPILKNNPESRYIVFLMHYFDLNPGSQITINSKLSESTLKQIEAMKKSFKLGC